MSQIRYTNTYLIHMSHSTNLKHASFTWVIDWFIDRIYRIGVCMNQSYHHVSFTWVTWLIHKRHGTCFIHPFERDMSLKRPIWTTWHMNQSYHPSCDWDMSQISAVTHMNEVCRTYACGTSESCEWVMSHMHGSCHTWMGHVTNQHCGAYEWGVPHACMRQAGCILALKSNISHIWLNHVL